VLSLFFASEIDVGAVVALVEDVGGRVVRGVADIALRVAPVREDLVGLVGLAAVARPAVLLSVVVAGVIVDLRSVEDGRVFVAGVRVVVEPAMETLFAVPVIPGFLFSSVELVDC
jgi:hypothetical protein